ncbi:hypothetical protein PanWU01x14_041320 [Parasponia andersonii]|uniref:Transposase, Ptta/En/Spm, plant n=1 Tax=Parasponia andersonii TaxID=3476 RepID=A0A2P5DQE7_PARAD|nr:hypothetical protein PanWU01x14_041320 [Parasponia andersonii]
MAPGIGRRGRHGWGRGSYVTQGRRGWTWQFFCSRRSCNSTSLDGLGDSTSPSASQQRMGDPPSSQTPFSTAFPSATTSGSGAIRGPTCGKKIVLIAKSATGGKLSVTFDAACRQPIYVNAERFNNEIGYIVRHHGIFHHKEWRLVPEDERAPLQQYLLEVGVKERVGVDATSSHPTWRGFDSTTGQIETWRERYYDPDKGWICSDLESIYDRMIALRAEHTPEVLSDKDIMEHILGRHSIYLKGWGQSPSGSTATSDMNSGEPRRPTYDELAKRLTSTQQQLFEVVEGLNECRQVLREHNLMPPPRSEGSCHVAGEATWQLEAMPRGVTMSCHVAEHVCATWQLVVVPCGCTRSCQVATLDCDMCLLIMLPCHHCKELHEDATSDYTSTATSESMSLESSHVGRGPVNIIYT